MCVCDYEYIYANIHMRCQHTHASVFVRMYAVCMYVCMYERERGVGDRDRDRNRDRQADRQTDR